MKIKQEISAEILNAATAVLSPYILDLTASVRSNGISRNTSSAVDPTHRVGASLHTNPYVYRYR